MIQWTNEEETSDTCTEDNPENRTSMNFRVMEKQRRYKNYLKSNAAAERDRKVAVRSIIGSTLPESKHIT